MKGHTIPSFVYQKSMYQPVQPPPKVRNVRIMCFRCSEDLVVQRKSWEENKKICCPHCQSKEVLLK